MSEPTLRDALGVAINDALYDESGWRLTQDELDAVLRAVASQPVTDAEIAKGESLIVEIARANDFPISSLIAYEYSRAALEAARAARTETP